MGFNFSFGKRGIGIRPKLEYSDACGRYDAQIMTCFLIEPAELTVESYLFVLVLHIWPD